MSSDPCATPRRAFTWSRSAQQGSSQNDEPHMIQRSATMPRPPQGWVEEIVSAYNLKWTDLRKFLISLFGIQDPQRLMEKQEMYEDKFYFWVPRRLKEAELRDIDRLRRKPKLQDPRPVTPDGNTQARDQYDF